MNNKDNNKTNDWTERYRQSYCFKNTIVISLCFPHWILVLSMDKKQNAAIKKKPSSPSKHQIESHLSISKSSNPTGSPGYTGTPSYSNSFLTAAINPYLKGEIY